MHRLVAFAHDMAAIVPTEERRAREASARSGGRGDLERGEGVGEHAADDTAEGGLQRPCFLVSFFARVAILAERRSITSVRALSRISKASSKSDELTSLS
jgi:hypothetical protein